MWKMSVLMPDWAGLVRNERCLMQMDDIAILRMNWSNGGSVGRQSERLVGDVTGMAARRPVVTLPTAVPTTSTATSRTINENPPIDKLIIGRAVSGLRNKWAERVALTTFATEATNEQTNKQTNKKTNRNGTNNDDNNSDNNQKEQEDETNETHFKKNVPSECIELKIKRKHPSPIRRSERAFGMEIDGKNDNKKKQMKKKIPHQLSMAQAIDASTTIYGRFQPLDGPSWLIFGSQKRIRSIESIPPPVDSVDVCKWDHSSKKSISTHKGRTEHSQLLGNVSTLSVLVPVKTQ